MVILFFYSRFVLYLMNKFIKSSGISTLFIIANSLNIIINMSYTIYK